jgi:site-specific DNA-cytosine methylase
MPTFKFIDLFAGIGGMRIAFERAQDIFLGTKNELDALRDY